MLRFSSSVCSKMSMASTGRSPLTRSFSSFAIGARSLYAGSAGNDPAATFEKAQKDVLTLPSPPSNEDKLKLYALFKQASVGRCNSSQPGVFQFVERAKWTAWNELGSMSKEDAMKKYTEFVQSLLKAAGVSSGTASSAAATAASSNPSTPFGEFKDILVSLDSGVLTIKFNRPSRKNAFAVNTYNEVTKALGAAASHPDVRVAVLTGAGDTYSSGNDLSNFMNIPEEGPAKLAADSRELLYNYVKAYIHFPKLLIAGVNGPALGIAVTVLGLADVVFASEKATFKTPFTSLGQSPEGCSSYTFPAIMGPMKANSMLLLGTELSAVEAERLGFVSKVLPQADFHAQVHQYALEVAKLPPQSLQLSKKLVRERDLGVLDDVNRKECELLEQRWLSEECMSAIMAFMSRKK